MTLRMMPRYVITTHEDLAGCYLSKLGQWGNRHYPDDSSAAEAARIDAGPSSFVISRETIRRTHLKGK